MFEPLWGGKVAKISIVSKTEDQLYKQELILYIQLFASRIDFLKHFEYLLWTNGLILCPEFQKSQDLFVDAPVDPFLLTSAPEVQLDYPP